MPDHAKIADAVFAAMTDEDNKHLAEAVAAAALSEDGDGMDTFYINLSNAGVPTPGRAGEPVTERDLRLACPEVGITPASSRAIPGSRRGRAPAGHEAACLTKKRPLRRQRGREGACDRASREALLAIFDVDGHAGQLATDAQESFAAHRRGVGQPLEPARRQPAPIEDAAQRPARLLGLKPVVIERSWLPS
ncbi:hypothetical protein ACWFZ6_18700 [Methylorubrum extorquens]|jgi:hypothetical protein|uniref:hypothetical protein n=1 Tax=Methylorubrum sp. GM97 TaxID=2938232 RepID=UPI001AE5461F|nr:hypothetical protein [Methylorubrum sp. GM97]BDL37486.1 hypothetical protein MSPGM_00760 [Methylorubrum sp. GM97]